MTRTRDLMQHRLARLTDPRQLFLVAATLAAMGLLAGYVEVQAQAERALALRAGPRTAIPIQVFTPDRDLPATDEVAVLA